LAALALSAANAVKAIAPQATANVTLDLIASSSRWRPPVKTIAHAAVPRFVAMPGYGNARRSGLIPDNTTLPRLFPATS
jgi:hypothetical protein